MQVLFDQGTPVPLRRYLALHAVAIVFEKKWSTLQNGELLRTAERPAATDARTEQPTSPPVRSSR